MDADLDRRLLRFRNLSKKEDAAALARDLLSLDRTRDAMEVAATGLRRRPDSAGLVVVLGRVLLEGGDLERAQEAFLQASRMDRTNAEPLRYLGETLLRQGDPKRAAKVLGRGLALGDVDETIKRLHTRATRLARGMAVAPDPELDASSETTEHQKQLPSDAPPQAEVAGEEASRSQSSHPPRSRSKTLMMGSEPPEGQSSQPPPVQSSPSIEVSQGSAASVRSRRQTTPHGVAKVTPAKSTLMFDPAAMPDAAPGSEPPHAPEDPEPQKRAVTIAHDNLPDPAQREKDSGGSSPQIEVETAPPQPTPSEESDEEILVARHAHKGASRPAKKAPWALIILLPLLIAVVAFIVVQKVQTSPEPKNEYSFFRALLQPDKAELVALTRGEASNREKALAAAHLVYRDGLTGEKPLLSLIENSKELKAGEADAVRATLELMRGNIDEAVKLARAATIKSEVSIYAKYLAGRALVTAGLAEGEPLLREAITAKPNYRDAILALAMCAYLRESEEESRSALRSAPSDDVDAIVPLYRSAVESPTQPAKTTKTDKDLISSYGAASELIRIFVHGDGAEFKTALDRSKVRDPLNLGLAASVALARGAAAPALDAALRAQRLVPDHAGVRRIVAKSAFALNDPSAAWTALSGYNEHDEESLTMLGRTAVQTRNVEYMKDALKRIDARKDTSVHLQALGIELRSALAINTDNQEELLHEAKALSASNPGNVSALKALISTADTAGNTDAFRTGLEELVRAAPQDAHVHLQYGKYWQSEGDFEKAETGYSRALSLSPNEREAAILLGKLLLEHGHYGKAELHYRNDVLPGADATIGRTRALAASGRNVDGLAELEKALVFEQLSEQQRLELANAALLLSRADHAETLVKDLAKGATASVEIIVAYAKALSAQGKAEDATEQLDRALETAPESIAALLAKSEAAVHAGKPATAHKYLALVYPKINDKKTPEPIRAKYWLLRGRAYLLEGSSGLDNAREALRGAVKYRGTVPEAYFFLGESLASANSPEAAKAYADYVALAPNGQFRKRAERALGDRK